jgi:ribosomal protein S12 methylthiotransferase
MSAPTVWLTTLGCAKNQVDSEKLSAMLDEAGYGRATDPARADVVMVNTCAFIEAARAESVEAIFELDETKRPDAGLVVLGCMAQRFGSEISAALPEADAVLGLERYGDLIGTLDRITDWQPVGLRRSPMDILHAINRPAPSLPYAYVKVAEGCDKPCTFCAIPLIRGKQRSRRPANIRDEIQALTTVGVSEIVLVAQDLASYGRDIEATGGLVDLLRFISGVDGLRRLRLLYLYPKEIRPALIAEMAENPLIAPYFDLSLQHAEARLLRAMRRPGDGNRYLDLIDRIKSAVPDAALRSSFIVGFPGETETDVETLAEFLQEAQLDWAGFFPYSPEEGTPAFDLPDRVHPDAVPERLRYLQRTQDDLTEQANAAQVGRVMELLIDQVEDGVPVGRTYREAPDIDGMVTLDRGRPGEWVSAKIAASYGIDLAAEVLEA